MPIKPINFNDTKTAYALKTNNELKLAKFLFSVLQSSAISEIGRRFLKFSIAAKLPVKGLIKATLFKHFIGGESINATKPLMKRLRDNGVHSILDYSLEGIETENEFDKAVREFKANVVAASECPEVPFSVFKPSAIARHAVLHKVSEGEALSAPEQKEYNRIEERFDEIFSLAHNLKVRVMIDAEESWIQNAIDALAMKMMRLYNREEVIAMNTYQMYRHDRLVLLQEHFNIAQQEGFRLGAKLVRGAYMEKERERAEKMGYPSPININKEATDESYNSAVMLCLNNLAIGEVFIGTHNEFSVLHAVEIMDAHHISHNDNRVWFSQLYGMCDYISFNLAHEGFNVAKYVPYGPVKSVIPYLIRRADENSSVSGQASKELKLINEELDRRNA